ncbi:MAG: choice-of-anchor J domain-containing protein [Bacteroidota bacterium]
MKKIYTLLMLVATITHSMAQVVFLETFDGVGGPTAGGAGTYTFPSGWTLLNLDARTPDASVAYVNDAWERREDFSFNVADSAAFSTSYYSPVGAADDWMWTPAIPNLPANTRLSWNAVAYDAQFQDGYEVRIMTTAPNAGNVLTSTVLFSTPAEVSTWVSRNVSLGTYAGQTVYIGFRNNSTDKFLLLIDDVKVETIVNNDLRITSAVRLSEYTFTPLAQVPPTGYTLGAAIQNNALSNATNVALSVTVYNSANALVHSSFSAPIGLLSGASANVSAAASFVPAAVDDYMVVYHVVSDSADQQPTNNADTAFLSITNSTYARDNGVVTGSLGIGAGNGGYMGQDFILHQSADLNFVDAYFTQGYTGEKFAAVVWSMAGDTVPSAIIASTDTLLYPDDSARYYHIPMAGGSVNLPAGRYAITFVEFDSTLALGLTEDIFVSSRTWVDWPTNPLTGWANNEDFGSGFARPYVIRPTFCSIASGFTVVNQVCTTATGSATINVTNADSPLTYAWGTGAATSSITSIVAGNYPVTVTDALGCSLTAAVNVLADNTVITSTTTATQSVCTAANGSATVAPTNGTANYTYAWDNSATTATAGNLAAGTYNVTVTDANGCSGTASAAVTANTVSLTVAGTTTNASTSTSSDGAITLNVTGGTAPFTTNPASLTGLTPGSYNVDVTDANGCTGTGTFTVSFNTGLADISAIGSISIYPNPASDKLFVSVDLKQAGDVTITLYSTTGASVYSVQETNVVARTINIPVAELPAGVYNVQLKTQGGIINRMVEIQK